ncbi:hypothetical protein B0H19DRAFT_168016 [Mycena capillaripes]|nr:hypothetical protein B0H19DRAFT_168016 [Mycena capillaripes]
MARAVLVMSSPIILRLATFHFDIFCFVSRSISAVHACFRIRPSSPRFEIDGTRATKKARIFLILDSVSCVRLAFQRRRIASFPAIESPFPNCTNFLPRFPILVQLRTRPTHVGATFGSPLPPGNLTPLICPGPNAFGYHLHVCVWLPFASDCLTHLGRLFSIDGRWLFVLALLLPLHSSVPGPIILDSCLHNLSSALKPQSPLTGSTSNTKTQYSSYD